MVWRRSIWFDNDDAATVYSPEQYRELRAIAGTHDQAQARKGLSETELRHLCKRLEVGERVVEEAIQLYRQAIRTDLVNNYLNGSLMAAAVYTACRKYGVPRTFGDVDDAAYVRVASDEDSASARSSGDHGLRPLSGRLEMKRVYNRFRDRFDRRYPQVEPEKFVQRDCEHLELDQEVEEVARMAITMAGDKALSGMDPNSIAAGAIYYASKTLGRDVTQREIEYVSGYSVTTIQRTRDVIKDSIEP